MVSAYLNKGNALNCLDRKKEAQKCYDKTLELKQDHLSCLFNQGITHINCVEMEKAKQCFDQLQIKDSDFMKEFIETKVHKCFVAN